VSSFSSESTLLERKSNSESSSSFKSRAKSSSGPKNQMVAFCCSVSSGLRLDENIDGSQGYTDVLRQLALRCV